MKDKIIRILEYHSINEENQAGLKGNVIWDNDFKEVSEEIYNLFTDLKSDIKDRIKAVNEFEKKQFPGQV